MKPSTYLLLNTLIMVILEPLYENGIIDRHISTENLFIAVCIFASAFFMTKAIENIKA